MPEKEKNDGNHPFHRERGGIIFNSPEDEQKAQREQREREQHEFNRSQVEANLRVARFTKWLVIVSCITTFVAIWQGTISQKAANAAKDAADTASKTLGEIQKSNLASSQQSTATLAEMKGQTVAQQQSAKAIDAARKSSEESARQQLEANARQNDSTLKATIDSFHREERAWVGIASAIPVEYSPNATNGSVNMIVAFTLKNYGRSAAEHVRFLPELSNDPTVNSLSCEEVPLKNHSGDVLLPTQERTLNFVMNLTAEQMAQGWSHQNPQLGHDLFLRILGCVEYADREGEIPPHRTPFTYIVFRKGGFITADSPIPASELSLDTLGTDSNETH